jgi:predicted phosphoadenosine phosphosulfate sulfurtransferase
MWTTGIYSGVYNFYPIYDYSTEDVWAAVFRNNFSFNEFYELAYKSGIGIHEARICQPYGHQQRQGLDQYAKIEPETWQKVVNRVSGANFGNIYCKTSLLGHNGTMKPAHMNWEEYAVFMLESLGLYCPELTKHYYRKIKILMQYYKDTENKTEVTWMDNASPKEQKQNPKTWYNWRRIALAIEKNDFELRSCQYGLTRVDETELYEIASKYGKMLGIEEKKTKTYLKYQEIL